LKNRENFGGAGVGGKGFGRLVGDSAESLTKTREKNTPITRTKWAINLLNHVILTMQLLQFEEGSLVITLM
jgi:hypothetical protein